jgi:hypothetical protein
LIRALNKGVIACEPNYDAPFPSTSGFRIPHLQPPDKQLVVVFDRRNNARYPSQVRGTHCLRLEYCQRREKQKKNILYTLSTELFSQRNTPRLHEPTTKGRRSVDSRREASHISDKTHAGRPVLEAERGNSEARNRSGVADTPTCDIASDHDVTDVWHDATT